MVSVLPLNASVSHLRHPVLQPTEAVFINFEKAQGDFAKTEDAGAIISQESD